jgi:phosphatidylglycerol:prolipoprotein diacylglycerol transferase
MGGVLTLVLTFPGLDPVAFHLGPLAVHWYGIMYALAFIVGYRLLVARLSIGPTQGSQVRLAGRRATSPT